MITDLSRFCVRADQTLLDVMRCIERNTEGIALTVDALGHLLYTITDGDLRRTVLNGLSLDLTVAEWARMRPEMGNHQPMTAPVDATPAEMLARVKPLGL